MYVWKLAMPQNCHFYYILENMGPLSYSLDLRGALLSKKTSWRSLNSIYILWDQHAILGAQLQIPWLIHSFSSHGWWHMLDPHDIRNHEDDEEAKRGVAAARAVAAEGQRAAPWGAEDAAGAWNHGIAVSMSCFWWREWRGNDGKHEWYLHAICMTGN